MDFIKYRKTTTEVDGIKRMDLTPIYDGYHELNGGIMSAMVEAYKATHDESNSPEFTYSDVVDLYGTSLEKNDGGINPEDLIVTGIYAGLALAEQYAENDEVEHCFICGAPLYGFGCNAEPYAHGRCCHKCDWEFVIPERVRRMNNREPISKLEK